MYRVDRWARLQRAAFFPKFATSKYLSAVLAETSSSTYMSHSTSTATGNYDSTLPEWLREEMSYFGSFIEPQLYPTQHVLTQYRRAFISNNIYAGEIYFQLVESIDHRQYDYCFLLPWLKRGGADKVALQFINAVISRSNASVLVILTEDTDSPWREQLPNQSRLKCIKLVTGFHSLDQGSQQLIIATLLQHCITKGIHIINSPIAWQTLNVYGRVLANTFKINAHAFCTDYNPDGSLGGYVNQFIHSTHDFIYCIYTENQAFIDQCNKLYGLPKDKFKLHRQWVSSPTIKQHSTQRTKTIVWAGRLDRQKRPDILLSIVQSTPELQYEVFGYSSDKECADIVAQLGKTPNVRLHQAYDSFERVAALNPAALLYTSQWDGLPNVLLEAASHLIPIIAPNVGGVSELITRDTGYLVDQFDDITSYVFNIKHLLAMPDESERRVNALCSILDTHYSQTLFNAVIDEYLVS